MTDRITEAKKVFERWARENDMCLEPGNGRMYANEQTERAFLLRCKPDQKELRNASAVLRAHQFLRNLGVVDDAACDVTELVKLMQTGRNADRYLLLRNNVGQGKLFGILPEVAVPFSEGQKSYAPLGLDDACDHCLKVLRDGLNQG